MKPDDPRHGTVAGHVAGCRCNACRNAKYRYEKRRAREHSQGVRRLHPSTGTVRRIRALVALGWDLRTLSTRMGRSQAYVRGLLTHPTVTTPTRCAVNELYDALSMTPGPSTRAARFAARKGWPPPLAWDDIDNPNEQPQGHEPTPLTQRSRREALLEAVRELLDHGEHPTAIAERVNRTPRNLARTLYRHAPDLARRFNSEETRSRAA